MKGTTRASSAYLLLIASVVGCATRSGAREAKPDHAAATAATVAAPSVAAAGSAAISVTNSRARPAIAAPPPPREPFTLSDEQGRPIDIYPPVSTEPRSPLVVVLHATCMKPASVCDWFGSAGRDSGWLVCPSGNSTCYGEPDWHGPGPVKAAFLLRALDKVEERIPALMSDRPGVLIGWSRGAFAARDILDAIPGAPQFASLAGRFSGLVLLAAAVRPDIKKLRAVGVARVVMAAGDSDGARPVMKAAAAALREGGLEARYVSLGRIGHVWPEDFEARMREPIAWAAGSGAPPAR